MIRKGNSIGAIYGKTAKKNVTEIRDRELN